MVECGGLENRCPAIAGPGVRIPLPPQKKANPVAKLRDFFIRKAQTPFVAFLMVKDRQYEVLKEFAFFCRILPNGITK